MGQCVCRNLPGVLLNLGCCKGNLRIDFDGHSARRTEAFHARALGFYARAADVFFPVDTRFGKQSPHGGRAGVYGNIGGFFALRVIGVAVINYRLQPAVTWREQVRAVAGATSWVYSHISQYVGNPRRSFLMGHSARAQFAAHAALNSQRWMTNKLARESLRVVIFVSGAGLNLSDEKTYELGQNSLITKLDFDRTIRPIGGAKLRR